MTVIVLPNRLYRTRRAYAFTPPGAIYCGRPTLWANPFERRAGIGHARSVILYEAWIRGQLDAHVLTRCGFGEHEIAALWRWRGRLLDRLHILKGHDLQCWCPPSTNWCHVEILLPAANDNDYLRVAA